MTINVAVVGLGKMGLSHLAIINSLEAFNVIGICDSATLVGNVIAKYGNLRYSSDYSELLDQPNLQAVVIATPSATHMEMVRAALKRGLHVFCEKPLTLSLAESRELVQLATENGLVNQVGYHNRFIGTFGEARRLIANGALGRINHVLAEAYGPVVLRPSKPTWRGKSGQGGGCLYDYAAHPLNLLTWLFGTPESCESAILKSGFSAEVDDEVYAMFRFQGGATGQISVNWSDASVRKMTTKISIWGDGGKLVADRQELQLFLTDAAPIPVDYSKGWSVRYITELTPPVSFYLRGEEYSAQLESFGRAISGSDMPHENDFASSAQTDATIEMIRSVAMGASMGTSKTMNRQSGVLGRMLRRKAG